MNYTSVVRIIIDLFAVAITIYALTQPIASRTAVYQNSKGAKVVASGESYPNKNCSTINLNALVTISKCDSSVSDTQQGLFGMYITFVILSTLCIVVCLFSLEMLSNVVGLLHMVLSMIILLWLIINIKTNLKSMASTINDYKLISTNTTEFTTSSILIITATSLVILKEFFTNGYIRAVARKIF